MPSRSVIKGPTGVIRWAYHAAAQLGPWTLSADSEGTTLEASVLSQDAFAVSQQPLTFQVPRPKGSWTWPVQSLQIVDGRLTARLGSPE